MTGPELQALANKIKAECSYISSFFTAPRGDGSRRTIWGHELTEDEYDSLVAQVLRPSNESQRRAIAAHDAAVSLQTRRRRR